MTGREVRRIREARGETQLQLAQLLGVTATTIWRWENDYSRVSPPVAMLIRTLDQPISASA